MDKVKKCSRCKEIKPLPEFRRDKASNSKDGRSYQCKSCAWIYIKASRAKKYEKYRKANNVDSLRSYYKKKEEAKGPMRASTGLPIAC